MSHVISCTVPTFEKTNEILENLKNANVPNSAISILVSDGNAKKNNGYNIVEKNTKAPEGAATGGGTGAILGGVLGWLVGIGSLAIPGVGPFIAAGPIMAALSGVAVGAAAGGVLGSLIGLGIPELEAKQYEKDLKEGHSLIVVHPVTDEQKNVVRQIFKNFSANNITETKDVAA